MSNERVNVMDKHPLARPRSFSLYLFPHYPTRCRTASVCNGLSTGHPGGAMPQRRSTAADDDLTSDFGCLTGNIPSASMIYATIPSHVISNAICQTKTQ